MTPDPTKLPNVEPEPAKGLQRLRQKAGQSAGTMPTGLKGYKSPKEYRPKTPERER